MATLIETGVFDLQKSLFVQFKVKNGMRCSRYVPFCGVKRSGSVSVGHKPGSGTSSMQSDQLDELRFPTFWTQQIHNGKMEVSQSSGLEGLIQAPC